MAEALAPILSSRIEALANQVLTEADLRGLRLATAESCTGGLLASLLTDIPLLSHVFDRAFVTYTNAAKHQMLNVEPRILQGPGPVSQEAAEAMAIGALTASEADLVISVTGWAEAGPDPEKPAGRVHLACASQMRITEHRKVELGDIGRSALRVQCLEIGLEMLLAAMTRQAR